MKSVEIILLCVVSAVIYGVCHDQVTARVCVEYFTVGHPPIFTPIEFQLRNLPLASVDILIAWGTIVWMVVGIWPHYKWVAVAQVPYFVWVSIAMVLQLSITWMNWGRLE